MADLKHFKGVIMDKDGTMFDTERLYDLVWMETGEKYGLEITPEWIDSLRGCIFPVVEERTAERFPQVDGKHFVAEMLRRAEERQLTELEEKPGLKKFLAYLKQRGVLTAVASSAHRGQIIQNLKTAGIEELIDAVVSGDEVEHGKPAPDIFLKAAESLGLFPGECLAIEDSPNGIRSAHAAGCYTIMIPDLIQPEEDMKKIYDDLSEDFFELLGKMQA